MKKSVLFCLVLASVLWGVSSAAMEPMPELSKFDKKLFSLVKKGSVDIDELRKLCKQGANIFAVDHYNDNVSLLHLVFLGKCNVVSNNIEELLDTLLTLGEEQDSKKVAAWCNLQTKAQKLTALHLAASGGASRCIALLLQVGANPNIVEKEYNTPVDVALYSAKCNPKLKTECLLCAECLLDHKGFDFAQKNGPLETTILHYVCKLNEVKYVKLVVEKAKQRMEDDEFKKWLGALSKIQLHDGTYEQVSAIFLAGLYHPHYKNTVEYLEAQGESSAVTFSGEDICVKDIFAMARAKEKITGKNPIVWLSGVPYVG